MAAAVIQAAAESVSLAVLPPKVVVGAVAVVVGLVSSVYALPQDTHQGRAPPVQEVRNMNETVALLPICIAAAKSRPGPRARKYGMSFLPPGVWFDFSASGWCLLSAAPGHATRAGHHVRASSKG